MKVLKSIIKTLFNIIFIILVLFLIIALYSFLQMNISNKKYANIFGYSFFEVTTGSMANTLEINDIVIVKITKDVKENDIITFLYKDEIITHRVIKKTEDILYTQGDANNEKDKPINKEDVIGKVTLIIPKLGIWIKVFSDMKVIISILITIALFGAALSDNKKEEQKEETTFSNFMRKRRERRNGKDKKKKEKS